MSLEENKAIIRRLVETFNKHDVTLWDEFIAPDFVDHTIPLQGLDNFKQFETMFINGFPDYHETIEDIVAEGDTVWIYFKVTATHTGEWNLFGVPLPPTGKKVTYTVEQTLGSSRCRSVPASEKSGRSPRPRHRGGHEASCQVGNWSTRRPHWTRRRAAGRLGADDNLSSRPAVNPLPQSDWRSPPEATVRCALMAPTSTEGPSLVRCLL